MDHPGLLLRILIIFAAWPPLFGGKAMGEGVQPGPAGVGQPIGALHHPLEPPVNIALEDGRHVLRRPGGAQRLQRHRPVLEQARAALLADPTLCPVRVVTRTITAETVAFSAEETKDARIPKGSRLIVQLGRAGERLSTAEKTYLNGKLQGTPAVTVQDTLPPVAQRVAVGTFISENTSGSQGEKGPEAPKGFSLTLPIKAEIISNFGMNKSGMNYGIDLKCKVGDAVSAPAAGTVVFAGKRGSYGFVLEIDHGGGFVTRTAPLKDCALKIGDTISAGAPIGKVSAPEDEEDTPYLHMELLIGGIPYNPRQYRS